MRAPSNSRPTWNWQTELVIFKTRVASSGAPALAGGGTPGWRQSAADSLLVMLTWRQQLQGGGGCADTTDVTTAAAGAPYLSVRPLLAGSMHRVWVCQLGEVSHQTPCHVACCLVQQWQFMCVVAFQVCGGTADVCVVAVLMSAAPLGGACRLRAWRTSTALQYQLAAAQERSPSEQEQQLGEPRGQLMEVMEGTPGGLRAGAAVRTG